MVFDALRVPIVQAPLAGGASTPALTAAVVEAGGLGFVAAGYRAPDRLREDVAAVRALTREPFGVNLFVPGSAAEPSAYSGYVASLADEARAHEVSLGEARFEDDAWDAKLELLEADPVAIVSFTFGCPQAEVVARLRAAGSEVWVTVTDPDEASQAAAAGADALIAQGIEAGIATGRAVVNRFLREHSADAPAAYPEIHHVTAPLRAAGDPDVLNLWAGQAHELAPELSAVEVVATMAAGAREALADVSRAWG